MIKGQIIKKILFDVQQLLKDEDQLNLLMENYPHKGGTQKENAQYRAERIDHMLKLAGDINYNDYIMAIKKEKRHC